MSARPSETAGAPDDFDTWSAAHADECGALYAASGGAAIGLPLDSFVAALRRAAIPLRRASVPLTEWSRHFHTCRLDDLALVAACLERCDGAWDLLVSRHRDELVRAGRAMAGDQGDELAASVFAELFGVDERGRVRRSPLESFQGRSRLATWLRTIMAQRHIDRWRRVRREEPVELHADDLFDGRDHDAGLRVERERLSRAAQLAVEAALATLAPVDRTRVALYYGRGLSLAQIGRLLREHEATVSRKLARVRREVDAAVRQHLTDVSALEPAAVEEAIALLRDHADVDLDGWLAEDGRDQA